MDDDDRDQEFDYLRGQSAEQQEAADDVEPRVEDSPQEIGSGEDKNRERVREQQAGL